MLAPYTIEHRICEYFFHFPFFYRSKQIRQFLNFLINTQAKFSHAPFRSFNFVFAASPRVVFRLIYSSSISSLLTTQWYILRKWISNLTSKSRSYSLTATEIFQTRRLRETFCYVLSTSKEVSFGSTIKRSELCKLQVVKYYAQCHWSSPQNYKSVTTLCLYTALTSFYRRSRYPYSPAIKFLSIPRIWFQQTIITTVNKVPSSNRSVKDPWVRSVNGQDIEEGRLVSKILRTTFSVGST